MATLAWVGHNTSLPVPKVLSFQADRASTIGFEWITMSKMPGTSFRDRWRDVTFSAKEQIVRRLALFCSETFRAQLQGIGSLFLDNTGALAPAIYSAKTQSVCSCSIPVGSACSSGEKKAARESGRNMLVIFFDFSWRAEGKEGNK